MDDGRHDDQRSATGDVARTLTTLAVMAGVVVITDSTAYLPAGWAEAARIEIVPVQVIVDGVPYDERDDEQAAQVAAALRAHKAVTTSRPSPQRFADAIAAAQDAGATGVVIATLSARLSATWESAQLAAQQASIDVRVIDSQTIAMGLGFAVLTGARAARDGATMDEVEVAIRKTAADSRVLFYVDTLEYLRRGGRVGGAQALLGQALQVKPLLTLDAGAVTPLERVRTAGKALARMVELTTETVASGGMAADGGVRPRLAVQHLDARERAEELVALLAERTGIEPILGVIGGVVGAHVGPGTVAVVVAPGDAGELGESR